ncbi:hypothetical protein B5X24_HaOG209261 [Helicoverpa armigera]|nr:hypothetical protein B5X24_HaOG209261 [Helicoverpa armigera]
MLNYSVKLRGINNCIRNIAFTINIDKHTVFETNNMKYECARIYKSVGHTHDLIFAHNCLPPFVRGSKPASFISAQRQIFA